MAGGKRKDLVEEFVEKCKEAQDEEEFRVFILI